jgi:hypothetical protein
MGLQIIARGKLKARAFLRGNPSAFKLGIRVIRFPEVNLSNLPKWLWTVALNSVIAP